MPHRFPLNAVQFVVLAGALLAHPAFAEEPPEPATLACASHDVLVDALRSRYGERAVSGGLDQDGRLVQMFASARTGTWTILATRTDGTSCIMAVGKHFQQRPVSDGEAAALRGSRPFG